jgi:hypothetical protein
VKLEKKLAPDSMNIFKALKIKLNYYYWKQNALNGTNKENCTQLYQKLNALVNVYRYQ